MPAGGRLTETDAVTLLQSGWVLVVSEFRRPSKTPDVQAFVVDPETEQEWPCEAPSVPGPWVGRRIDNRALGARVPAQVVTGLGQHLPERCSLAGGLDWRLWYLTLQRWDRYPWNHRETRTPQELRAQPSLRSARRIHWEQALTSEGGAKTHHVPPRPLPLEEVRRRLARGHEFLQVRYWRGGPRSQPKGGATGWVQGPATGETERVPAPLLRRDWRFRDLLTPDGRLHRQGERCLRVGHANWEVVAFTAEPTRDWLQQQRTLTDEDGRPLPLGQCARVLEVLEQIEERVSPAPDWIMA